jgi:hypothetical protein
MKKFIFTFLGLWLLFNTSAVAQKFSLTGELTNPIQKTLSLSDTILLEYYNGNYYYCEHILYIKCDTTAVCAKFKTDILSYVGPPQADTSKTYESIALCGFGGACFSGTIRETPWTSCYQKDNNEYVVIQFYPEQKGIYTIRYSVIDETIPNKLTSFIITYVVDYDVKTGINEYSHNYDLTNISPNPAIENINVNYSLLTNSQNSKICIYDVLGNKVKEVNVDNGMSQTATISVSDLNDGMYFCELNVNGRREALKKFIVANN